MYFVATSSLLREASYIVLDPLVALFIGQGMAAFFLVLKTSHVNKCLMFKNLILLLKCYGSDNLGKICTSTF